MCGPLLPFFHAALQLIAQIILRLEGHQFWCGYKVPLYRLEALAISYLQSSDDPLYGMVIFL